jgi:ABC-type branched-subunit amino acid transport system ATPase component
VLGLLGPNGSGKTTLLNVLSGLTRPDTGTVALHGDQITRMAPWRRARRGLARGHQTPAFVGTATVLETVAAAGAARHGASFRRSLLFLGKDPGLRRATDEAWSHLRRAGLDHAAGEQVADLDLPALRRLELARAFALEPDVILLDEPSAGLRGGAAAAIELFPDRHLLGDIAVVVVDHKLPFLTAVADRLIALDAGRVIAEGQPDDVISNPAVRAVFVGDRA